MHPNHSSILKSNDIGLIKLTERISFNDKIQPACLYTDFDVDSNEKVVVTGWGGTPSNGEFFV